MKQHITPEQLDELSKVGVENYRTYINGGIGREEMINIMHAHARAAKEDGSPTQPVIDHFIDRMDGSLPLLSIGQMIEFLDEQCGKTVRHWSHRRRCETRCYMPTGNFMGVDIISDPDIELCDALWEACKDVLNNKSS